MEVLSILEQLNSLELNDKEKTIIDESINQSYQKFSTCAALELKMPTYALYPTTAYSDFINEITFNYQIVKYTRTNKINKLDESSLNNVYPNNTYLKKFITEANSMIDSIIKNTHSDTYEETVQIAIVPLDKIEIFNKSFKKYFKEDTIRSNSNELKDLLVKNYEETNILVHECNQKAVLSKGLQLFDRQIVNIKLGGARGWYEVIQLGEEETYTPINYCPTCGELLITSKE